MTTNDANAATNAANGQPALLNGGASAPTPPPGWVEGLDADGQALVSAKGWKSAGDAVRSYAHLERQLGAEKIALPGREAGEAEWAAVWDRLGRPPSPDGYDLSTFKRPTEAPWDEAGEKAMVAAMHEAGLNGRQVAQLLSRYAAIHEDGWRESVRTSDRAANAAETELRRGWGSDYDAQLDLANRAIRTAFGAGFDAVRGLKLADGSFWGDHPEVVRAFARLGAMMAEDKIVDGEAGRGQGLTPRQARDEIARLHGDPNALKILTDAGHPEYAATVARRTRLFEIAYPRG